MNFSNGDWWSRQPEIVKACPETLLCRETCKLSIIVGETCTVSMAHFLRA